jgi:hypothetical protein
MGTLSVQQALQEWNERKQIHLDIFQQPAFHSVQEEVTALDACLPSSPRQFPLTLTEFDAITGFPARIDETFTRLRIAALPVASQRDPLQRRTTCCIAAQSLIAAATQPTPSAAAALSATDGCGGPQSAVESFRAPATADGVPRQLGTHTRGTIVAGCTGGRSSAQCVCAALCSAVQLGTAHPYRPASVGLDCVIAHTGLASYRPASPLRLCPPPAHIRTGTERIPRPRLHRD